MMMQDAASEGCPAASSVTVPPGDGDDELVSPHLPACDELFRGTGSTFEEFGRVQHARLMYAWASGELSLLEADAMTLPQLTTATETALEYSETYVCRCASALPPLVYSYDGSWEAIAAANSDGLGINDEYVSSSSRLSTPELV